MPGRRKPGSSAPWCATGESPRLWTALAYFPTNPGRRRRYPRVARDRVRGCLLGGAVGDALGAPVEFLSWPEIARRYGPDGIADLDAAYGRVGAITDDTQMTLFTAEGVLRGITRGNEKGIGGPVSTLPGAYLRWLFTQDRKLPHRRGYDRAVILGGKDTPWPLEDDAERHRGTQSRRFHRARAVHPRQPGRNAAGDE